MTDFNGAHPALAQALTTRGYDKLTPVQAEMLTPGYQDADLLVSAQTGSGKTVAFGLAIAPTLLPEGERFDRGGAPLALIVAPTRELALQVKRELEWLFKETGAVIASCVGGMDFREEKRVLNRGAHIVVGTPGRLVDHMNRHSLHMGGLRAVVLDEADEMLDMGFREDLETILGEAPLPRRTLMFSATVSKDIARLAKNYQQDAVRVNTQSSGDQHGDIAYRALTVASYDKENAIINVLRYYEARNAIVFCGTRATVNHLTSRLNNRGFSVVALSGELSQKERTHALQAMRDGRARVCVATDVAARGIDLPGLELVVHADLPKNTEGLLHRSGRTGRAGAKGVSALIVPVNARKRVDRLLREAKVKADWATPPTVEEVLAKDRERLLSDASLAEPVKPEEQGVVAALLEQYGPEQVAAAFLRAKTTTMSAPEELSEAPISPGPRDKREPRPRDDFTESAWVQLSIGRNQSAEPRWLLPMLVKAGGLARADIGAIRLQDDTTAVQVNAEVVEALLARAAKKNGALEQNIRVTLLDTPPADERPAHKPRPRQEAKPYSGKTAGKPKFTKREKPDGAPERGGHARAKPKRSDDAYTPRAGKKAGAGKAKTPRDGTGFKRIKKKSK